MESGLTAPSDLMASYRFVSHAGDPAGEIYDLEFSRKEPGIFADPPHKLEGYRSAPVCSRSPAASADQSFRRR
jgi:hypothetical protein